MSGPNKKTNVLRLLEAEAIPHKVHVYETMPAVRGENVFKTIVTSGGGNIHAVFCLPLELELDLRKSALASGCRKIALIPLDELQGLTGYERGGCSPLAMKKLFPTYLDQTALLFDTILISAGQIGMQVELAPQDLLTLGKRLLPKMDLADLT